MRSAIVLGLAFLAAAPEAGLFYAYPAGTVWTYDADFAGNARRVTYKVARVENEQRHVEFDIFREGDPGATASDDMVWSGRDGGADWSSEEADGTLKPRWRLWNAGAEPGSSWKGPDESETTYVGNEDIEVPAGRWTGAVHLKIRCDATVEFWYVAGVGFVKMVRTGGETRDTLLLRKVERPE